MASLPNDAARGLLLASIAALGLGSGLPAEASEHPGHQEFERIATFLVCENTSCDRDEIEETVAEIVAASEDGRTLVYTDGETERLGFVDLSDPANPQPLGTVEVAGEPTSVGVAGRFALLAVNTSESFTNPSGFLAVFDIEVCLSDIAACEPVATHDLGGQPDAVAISPSRRFAAVAIENERDEDVVVDGVEGGLPQPPAGFLQIVDLIGPPQNWRLRPVDLTGIADVAPSDPEPEFVAINRRNLAVVTLQENNHIVFVRLPSGVVAGDFSAGGVDLAGIDAVTDRVIDLTDDLDDLAREPDAIDWIGDSRIVTANEGDLFGGSRGFTTFLPLGRIEFDSAEAFEHTGVRIGHFPERRAGAKGTEPEGVETDAFDRLPLIFVGSERGNFVAVYQSSLGSRVEFLQVLPTGIGPEGLLAIPERNLFVVSAEDDDDDVRSQINIFERREGPASYPTIVSADDRQFSDGRPIGWGALSALAADRHDPDILFTVHDSFYDRARIYTVDVGETPAVIFEQTVLLEDGEPVDLDLEGLVQRSDGSFWLVSEGNGAVDDPEEPVETKNLLIRAAADGTVVETIELPAATNDLQRDNGFEGVAVTGEGADERVYVAFQREWVGDPDGLVRIGRFTPETGEWAFFHYPLDEPTSPAGGWVGLSEIVALGDGAFAVIERDNQGGPDATIKRIYRFSTVGLAPQPEGGVFPVVEKTRVADLLPDLQATNGWVLDKLEGLTVAADGEVYVVTDNDGVDDATGETRFLRLGSARDLGL